MLFFYLDLRIVWKLFHNPFSTYQTALAVNLRKFHWREIDAKTFQFLYCGCLSRDDRGVNGLQIQPLIFANQQLPGAPLLDPVGGLTPPPNPQLAKYRELRPPHHHLLADASCNFSITDTHYSSFFTKIWHYTHSEPMKIYNLWTSWALYSDPAH